MHAKAAVLRAVSFVSQPWPCFFTLSDARVLIWLDSVIAAVPSEAEGSPPARVSSALQSMSRWANKFTVTTCASHGTNELVGPIDGH